MIILLNDDPETGIGMRALKRIYGTSEQVKTYSDMKEEEDYALIKKSEPITRITFLGHSGATDRFGPFRSPSEFVDFLDRVISESLAKDPEFLNNLQTIDLFGCEVGHLIHGSGFVTEVSRLLSERGRSFKIRAFSHDPESEFEKTLLIQEKVDSTDSWEYVGLDADQNQQYHALKETEKILTFAVKMLNAHISKYNARLSEITDELETNAENSTEEWAREKTKLDREFEEVKHILASTISTKADKLSELHTTHDTIRQVLGHNVIVGRTFDPRSTLDTTPVCHFDSNALALAVSDSKSADVVKLEPHPKPSSSILSSELRERQAQMKEEMTTGRASLSASADAKDEKTNSSSSMTLGGGADDK